MSTDSLTTLLREAQRDVHRHQYTNALKIIRDAKIIDLHNVYLSALEQFVTKLPSPSSTEFSDDRTMEHVNILSLMIERAIADRERRSAQRTDNGMMTDSRTLMLEKIKNQYFQRTDQFIDAKDFGRALEEVQRIYFFDPLNIVAKEYQQKIGQLAELLKK